MKEILHSSTCNLQQVKASISTWSTPNRVKRDMLRFLDDLALGKVNRGCRISERRQVKYVYLLRIPLEFFRKELSKVRPTDVEAFEREMTNGGIISRFKARSYSEATKVDIRRALRVLFRWKLGEAASLKLAGWLDMRRKLKTPDYLKETEVEKLLKRCRTAQQRFLVAVLFDLGARASEFLNIRSEDILMPEGGANFIKVVLKQEYSKTLGRTVSLYWKLTGECLREYFTERLKQGMQPGDPVYNNTYNGMRMFLHRLGMAVLGRPVHPHLFRHSSATYYASRLNRQELCYRFGWRFSSNMPDVYISRSGMENRELDEKFTQTELSTLKEDLARITLDNQIKAQRMAELQQSLDAMNRNMQMITEVLAVKPSVRDVEAVLQRKRRAEATTAGG
ncbi:MAG: site-specific integrase [Verrucomicrobia bacterium]|nr:site-specific integrase [Verrucomicrobiota bacterium]